MESRNLPMASQRSGTAGLGEEDGTPERLDGVHEEVEVNIIEAAFTSKLKLLPQDTRASKFFPRSRNGSRDPSILTSDFFDQYVDVFHNIDPIPGKRSDYKPPQTTKKVQPTFRHKRHIVNHQPIQMSRPTAQMLAPAAENPRYDRQVNIFVESASISRPAPLDERLIHLSGSARELKWKFVGLAPKIRLLIYEQLMPPAKKVVSLDHKAVREKMAPEGHFRVPGDILWRVWGLIGSCRFMRDDVMSYFWETFTFHATLSPKIIGNLNYGSMVFLPRWAHKVQRLTIELDFTTLVGSANPDEPRLMFGKKKLQSSFTDIIQRVNGRGGYPTPNGVQYLHIMCRRLAGYRPVGHDHLGRPLLHCPELAMSIIHEGLAIIKERILSLRLSGFTEDYTIDTLKRVFPVAAGVTPVLMETPAWPNITPALVLSAGEKQVLCDRLLAEFGAVHTEASKVKAERAARRQVEEEKDLYLANAERIRRKHALSRRAANERRARRWMLESILEEEEEEEAVMAVEVEPVDVEGRWRQASEQPEGELDHDDEVASDDELDGEPEDARDAQSVDIYANVDADREVTHEDEQAGTSEGVYDVPASSHKKARGDTVAGNGGGLGRTASGKKLVSLGLGGVGVRQQDGSVKGLEEHLDSKDNPLKHMTPFELNLQNQMDPAFRIALRAMHLANPHARRPATNFDDIEYNLSREGKKEEEKQRGEKEGKTGTVGHKTLAKMASHLRLRK